MSKIGKPFLKWAGGKTQLIKYIKNRLPANIKGEKFTYIEPFIGSGALLFWMLNRFPKIEKAVINDVNKDLINVYKSIATSPKELIALLKILQDDYHSLEGNMEQKKIYYYEKRVLYNTRESELIQQAALFIFLNKTCFNGLYRVNSKNGFNVPMGVYKKPMICDELNILAVHNLLQKVEILNGDFKQTINFIDANTFFYFDPPYKPVSKSSSFTAYAKNGFDDNEQIRLAEFCAKLDELGCSWMLSNSDPKGLDPSDNFFEEIYANYNIKRVDAKRSINSNASKRGKLSELLITNYQYESTVQATLFD